jgi:hypothetical protein
VDQKIIKTYRRQLASTVAQRLMAADVNLKCRQRITNSHSDLRWLRPHRLMRDPATGRKEFIELQIDRSPRLDPTIAASWPLPTRQEGRFDNLVGQREANVEAGGPVIDDGALIVRAEAVAENPEQLVINLRPGGNAVADYHVELVAGFSQSFGAIVSHAIMIAYGSAARRFLQRRRSRPPPRRACAPDDRHTAKAAETDGTKATGQARSTPRAKIVNMLILGTLAENPELGIAITAVAEGLRAARSTSSLRRHYAVLEAAFCRA